MNLYEVKLERWATVAVYAESEEEALDLAMDEADEVDDWDVEASVGVAIESDAGKESLLRHANHVIREQP